MKNSHLCIKGDNEIEVDYMVAHIIINSTRGAERVFHFSDRNAPVLLEHDVLFDFIKKRGYGEMESIDSEHISIEVSAKKAEDLFRGMIFYKIPGVEDAHGIELIASTMKMAPSYSLIVLSLELFNAVSEVQDKDFREELMQNNKRILVVDKKRLGEKYSIKEKDIISLSLELV